MKEARLGVEIIEKEFQKVVFNDKTYLLHESSSIDIKEKERFIFLSAYDEYIIAYKYRGDVLQASHNSKAFTNGVFFPLILQNGRATGNWKMTLTRRNIAINSSCFYWAVLIIALIDIFLKTTTVASVFCVIFSIFPISQCIAYCGCFLVRHL